MITRRNSLETFKDLNEEYDFFTVSNGITIGRLAMAPTMIRRFRNDPYGTWPSTGAFLFTDKIDGLGTKVGKLWPKLRNAGFRESKFGASADVVVDKLVVSGMLVAGLAADVIPRGLGGLALAQRAFVVGYGLHARSRGAELGVNPVSQFAELATVTGIGLTVPAETIEDPEMRRHVRHGAMALAVTGLASAVVADAMLVREARAQLQQPTQP